MTARQAAQLAQHSGVQNLILTHFSPEHNLNQLRREAEAHYEGNLYMSASGKKYILQP
jgi:ribonuclease BN (tRNA processing enzyme)